MDFEKRNLFIEFQTNSTEFLRVLGRWSMEADGNKPVVKQLKEFREDVATLELFWDITEQIFLQYEARLQTERLRCFTEHAKSVILDKELRNTYNELFKVHSRIPEVIERLMKTTHVPTKDDLAKDVQIKFSDSTTNPDGKKD